MAASSNNLRNREARNLQVESHPDPDTGEPGILVSDEENEDAWVWTNVVEDPEANR
jgi:hypothetical protein